MKTVQTLQVLSATLLAIGLVVTLPLLGIMATGLPIGHYLEFPPHTHYVEHAGFSWSVFAGLAAFILIVILPFIIRILCANRMTKTKMKPLMESTVAPAEPPLLGSYGGPWWGGYNCNQNARRFPVWGWIGIAGGIGAWILAWSRFDWFAPWQAFTFSPLWFSYIVIVNALTHRRTGQCMLTQRPVFLLMLFVFSAAFWWLFEYLNRFVQNWYYLGIGSLTPLEYFLFATLPFSTVLPAVMGTFQLLATYPRLSNGLTGIFVMPHIQSRFGALIVLTLSAGGLAGIGLWPDYLFPLLWLAPLGILASLQTLTGRTSLFADLVRGDWRRIVLLALAALICGFFWEMWNFYSLAKWVYAVPFVDRFHIFEMPVLGYAGYLLFGLECALIADLLCGRRQIEEKP
ncbi:MAG: hypothetical protein KKG09_09055 [Verrucomicrobia bacterium]|nr:hypothetical protein [Verrucomicrobiota bacterium]MBU4291100.1 hypothetical protein [Verrucomicrobiota bacterium]MBU4429350.1 hypothetical protein [Verrucomicrobiota bacterium]MBU4498137.1 hypothetical protein [Verrucomicrobiota bacterium]MCG2680117.1 hypothetical protein [Kiritimatiellia bacterium]